MSNNPFEGLQRRRLPGMHMTTALDGGAPLDNTLAAFFFAMLHDTLPHECLVKRHEAELKQATTESLRTASSPDGMFMAGLFGGMAKSGLYGQEWSYITDEEAFLCLLLASSAIEQTQRWICDGVEEPMMIGPGPLVARPDWAAPHQAASANTDRRVEAREYVARLMHEVGGVAQTRTT